MNPIVQSLLYKDRKGLAIPLTRSSTEALIYMTGIFLNLTRMTTDARFSFVTQNCVKCVC